MRWVADGTDWTEGEVLRLLYSMAAADVSLATQVAGYPSVSDSVTDDQRVLFAQLASIAAEDIALASVLAGYLWVADGIDIDERAALRALRFIATSDPKLSTVVAAYPWIADGIVGHEAAAIDYVGSLAANDLTLANTIAGYSWVADDMSWTEQRALEQLKFVANDLDRASLVLKTARPVDSAEWDAQLLFDLARGALRNPTSFDELARYPWVADGLDEEEAALVAVLFDVHRSGHQRLYDDLVQSHYAQSATVSLTLAGDVNLWAFQSIPFPSDEDIVGMLEDAVRASEGFLGVPFPSTDVILVIPIIGRRTDHGIGGGSHWGRFIMVTRYEPHPINRGAIYHEVAHYYFRSNPRWLSEGGAEFMVAYTNDRVGLESLEDRKPTAWRLVQMNCLDRGMENIRQLNQRQSSARELLLCNYSLGAYFLLSLVETIGHEAVSAALGELYVAYSERVRTGEGRFGSTEKEIYEALLRNTPADKQDEFRALYRELHGGP